MFICLILFVFLYFNYSQQLYNKYLGCVQCLCKNTSIQSKIKIKFDYYQLLLYLCINCLYQGGKSAGEQLFASVYLLLIRLLALK